MWVLESESEESLWGRDNGGTSKKQAVHQSGWSEKK